MKLLTQAIIKTLPPLYSTKLVPLAEQIVRVKFFNPCGAGTWLVIEGSEEIADDGTRDWLFWGLAKLQCAEWGYFSLSELLTFRGPFGIGIERDLWFEPAPIGAIAEREGIERERLG